MYSQESYCTLLFDLNLTKQKIWKYWLKSKDKEILQTSLLSKLEYLTLDKIEIDLANGRSGYKHIIANKEAASTNPLIKFFKKYF